MPYSSSPCRSQWFDPSAHTQQHSWREGCVWILVQLRLEEMLQGNGLAATRQQLLKFYAEMDCLKTGRFGTG